MPAPPTPPTAPTGESTNVTQGPVWLAKLYLHPPGWLNPALKVVGVLAVAIVAYRLYQRGWEVDAPTQLVMGQIGATVVGVITGVLAVSNFTTNPYLVDVSAGFVLGYVGVVVALSARVRSRVAEYVTDDEERVRLAWMALATLSLVGPALAQTRGRGMSLVGARLAVAAVAAGMVALSFAGGESGDKEADEYEGERGNVAE